MVDVFQDGEKHVSATQRNTWSHTVDHSRVVLIWENFKTCFSLCKKEIMFPKGKGGTGYKQEQNKTEATEIYWTNWLVCFVSFGFNRILIFLPLYGWLGSQGSLRGLVSWCHQRLWPTSVLSPSSVFRNW